MAVRFWDNLTSTGDKRFERFVQKADLGASLNKRVSGLQCIALHML